MDDVRALQWEQDLEQLASELPKRHKKLFLNLKRKPFTVK